jgi:hypothetical protein
MAIVSTSTLFNLTPLPALPALPPLDPPPFPPYNFLRKTYGIEISKRKRKMMEKPNVRFVM